MRTIPELLKVMLENQELFEVGLCGWAYDIWVFDFITLEETDLMLDYIKKHRPNKISEFSWPSGELQPRIDWINEQLKKFEE